MLDEKVARPEYVLVVKRRAQNSVLFSSPSFTIGL
jgi:hypothetical protein